jgi:hypothetical protein
MDVRVPHQPKQGEKTPYVLEITIPKNQLKVLQDALCYASWQFYEGGAYPQSSVDFLSNLHDLIKERTGVTGEE